MKRIVSIKTAVLLPLAFVSAVTAVPAYAANWFSADPATGMRRHIGSAPNPTAEDLRALRVAADNAAKAVNGGDANKPASSGG